MRKMCTAAIALAFVTAPLSGAAIAQNRNVLNQQGGLVNVNVTNVDLLKNFANANEIEILNDANISVNAPLTVQAPINIAALVCGVDVNVLARGGPSRNSCDAEQGSAAFTDLAIRTIQNQ